MCRGDGSLIQSEQQINAYGNLVDYVDADGEGYGGTGFLAAALCIFMWIVVVAKEIDTVWNKILAMYCNSARTQHDSLTHFDHATHSLLQSHHRRRQVLFALLAERDDP